MRLSLTWRTETSSIMEEAQPEKTLEDTGSLEGGSGQLVTSGNRKHYSEPVAVQLKNMYGTLQRIRRSPLQ